jgi:hypothetical protein
MDRRDASYFSIRFFIYIPYIKESLKLSLSMRNNKWPSQYILYVVSSGVFWSRLPVEHLWEELREKYLHNRVFPSFDELIEMLCQALTELTDDNERLRSMMFFPHFRIEA